MIFESTVYVILMRQTIPRGIWETGTLNIFESLEKSVFLFLFNLPRNTEEPSLRGYFEYSSEQNIYR